MARKFYTSRFSIEYQGRKHHESVMFNIAAPDKKEAREVAVKLAERYFYERYNKDEIKINLLSLVMINHEPRRVHGKNSTRLIPAKRVYGQTKV